MDIIYDFWNDILHGDWTDKIMASLMFLVIGIVALLLCCGIFWVADTVGTENRIVKAQLINREHHPAWVQTNMIMAGKVLVPQTIYHPESWSVGIVTEENETLNCSCSRGIYDSFSPRNEILATVYSGRISRGTYCQGVQYP